MSHDSGDDMISSSSDNAGMDISGDKCGKAC